MKNTKFQTITGIGILTALYVALAFACKIPLIGHLSTDLGYIAFAVALMFFGWKGAFVGVAGCFIETFILQGWIPYGWIVGQLFIGLVCGLIYTKTDKKVIHYIVTVASVFIGVGLIKTSIECALFDLPFIVKLAKNSLAFVADTIPMLLGLTVSYKLRNRVKIKGV